VLGKEVTENRTETTIVGGNRTGNGIMELQQLWHMFSALLRLHIAAEMRLK